MRRSKSGTKSTKHVLFFLINFLPFSNFARWRCGRGFPSFPEAVVNYGLLFLAGKFEIPPFLGLCELYACDVLPVHDHLGPVVEAGRGLHPDLEGAAAAGRDLGTAGSGIAQSVVGLAKNEKNTRKLQGHFSRSYVILILGFPFAAMMDALIFLHFPLQVIV